MKMLGKLVDAVPEERQVWGHLYVFPSNWFFGRGGERVVWFGVGVFFPSSP